MTKNEALALPAGRELDSFVAEKVMGYQWRRVDIDIDEWVPRLFTVVAGRSLPLVERPKDFRQSLVSRVPEYSTSIADAWAVVEKWRDPTRYGGYGELAMRCEGEPDTGLWVVDFGIVGHGIANTAPLAICRAAIAALWKD